MRLLSFLIILASFGWIAACAMSGQAVALDDTSPTSPFLPASSPWEEPVEPLDVSEKQGEVERDKSLALAFFSTGRAMELRGRSDEAIRHYQRALFYEPSSTAAAEGVVRLAKKLDRKDVWFRYLLHWAELAPCQLSPETMVDLMDCPETVVSKDRLISVMQHLVSEREKAAIRTPGDLLLYWRLAEMLAYRDEFEAAAEAADHVVKALENPRSFGLEGELAEQIERQSVDALAQFADLFVDVGRTDQAERLYRKVHARDPNPIWLDLRLACVELKRNRAEVALKKLEPVLADPPVDEGFTPFAAMVTAYKQLGREAKLTEALESLRKKFPEHVPLLCFLGQYYLEKKDYDHAQKAFLASLKFQPTKTALVGIAEVGLATDDPTPWLGVLARQFETCESLTTLDEQVDRVALDPNPKLLAQTLKAADRILRDTPDRLGSYGPLAAAVIALRGKKFEQVEKLLPHVEKSTPEELGQLLLCWGTILFEDEKYDAALEVLQKGLARCTEKEELVSIEYLMAATYEMRGQTDCAIATINKAIARDPVSARLWYQKAWIFFHAKRTRESRHAFEELLAQTEKTHDVLITRLLVADSRQMLAHLASLEGNVNEAEEHLLTVLDEFPDDASVKNDLAFLWAESGKNLQKSLRLATETVQADPQNASYRDTLGWTYFRLGRLDQATEQLRQAVKLAPHNQEIATHLARVLESARGSD